MASSLITIDTRPCHNNNTAGYTQTPQYRRDSRSASSIRTDTTWRYSVFCPERMGKGSVLFTGPDGIRDHQVHVDAEHRYVGEGTMSPEGTSEVEYLWRAPSNESRFPFPKPKSQCVGEIGWGIPSLTHWSAPWRRAHIELGEFRQAVEDRHTHLYQNAWYPGPNEEFAENSDAALVMNVYKPSRGRRSADYTSRPQTQDRQYGNKQSAETQSYDARTVDTRDTGYVSNERRESQISSHRGSQASLASRHSSAQSGYSSQGDSARETTQY